MTKRIWKWSFPVTFTGEGILTMPINAKIIHVSNQNDVLMFWALIDDEDVMEQRTFIVHGTGHPIEDNEVYIGTALIPPFVWHLFERLEESK